MSKYIRVYMTFLKAMRLSVIAALSSSLLTVLMVHTRSLNQYSNSHDRQAHVRNQLLKVRLSDITENEQD